MAAAHSWDIILLVHFNSRAPQSSQKRRIVTAAQSWMCLLCGTEVAFDSEMELHAATRKPASAAFGEFRWLRQFQHSQQLSVKSSSFLFSAGRHRELNMIDRRKWLTTHTDMLAQKQKRRTPSHLLKSKISH